jgi:hypothetical protein
MYPPQNYLLKCFLGNPTKFQFLLLSFAVNDSFHMICEILAYFFLFRIILL